jgi:hypothetical protein
MQIPAGSGNQTKSRIFRKLTSVAAVSVCLFAADCVPMAVSSDFKYLGKQIHPGCIYELTPQLNGDNIAATVNLGHGEGRGCLDSNRYTDDPTLSADGFLEFKPADSGIVFGYRHIREIAPGVHHLQVRVVTTGTFSSLVSLVVRYEVDPVLDLDAKPPAMKYADRLSAIALGGSSKRDLNESEYAAIRNALRMARAPRFCAATSAK